MYAKKSTLSVDRDDPFYTSCCGLETFLGHTKDCVKAPASATRYRRLQSDLLEPGGVILACRDCGSLVLDYRAHDFSHDSKEKR